MSDHQLLSVGFRIIWTDSHAYPIKRSIRFSVVLTDTGIGNHDLDINETSHVHPVDQFVFTVRKKSATFDRRLVKLEQNLLGAKMMDKLQWV
jgi:hypothetical protein